MASRTLLSCLLLACAGIAGPKEPEEPDPKKDPEFVKSVNESIDKGVAWLLSKQEASGRFPAFEDARGDVYPLGMHVLATLTLIKSKQPVDSTPMLKAFKAVDSLLKEQRNNLRTYEVGILLMMLDAKNDPGAAREKKRRRKGPSPDDVKLAKEMVAWLQTKQKPSGLWRYPDGGEDLSNTQ
jgi:hypothetical protein